MHSLVPKEASRIGTVIGIDPGTSNLGFSCIEIDVVTLKIIRTYARTFSPEKYITEETIENSHGSRMARVFKLIDIMAAEFIAINPIAVISESPFMSKKRPTAYGPLTECVMAVRAAMVKWNPACPLYFIDPPSAKNAVGAKGNADKDVVLAAIVDLNATEEDIGFDEEASSNRKLTELDEHSSDGIAIAYSMIKHYRGDSCLFP